MLDALTDQIPLVEDADVVEDLEPPRPVPPPPPSLPDPHASKVPPNHPGLNLKRPPFRVLRRGPIVAVSMTLAGLAAIALGRGFLAGDGSAAASQGDPSKLPGPEAPAAANLQVEDLIKNAPGNSSPVLLPKAPEAPKPDLVKAGPGPLGGPTAGSPPGPGGPPPPPGPPDPRREARRQDLERARAGGLFFSGEGAESSPSDRPPGAAASGPGGELPAGAARPAPAEVDPNGQASKSAFMRDAAKERTNYASSEMVRPLSPYEVKAGSIIPTTLITGINSDLPGEVVAQVRENVFDTVTGNYLLIPQGSRLLARYDSAITYGQERVLLCWQRLVRPDGSSINLECAPGVDLSGQAGFADEVDNHWGKLISGVVLSSLLSAVTQASTGDVQGYRPSLAQSFTAGAASDFAAAGQQITRRNIGLQPTVKIRPGFSVNVLVNKDLIIPPFATR